MCCSILRLARRTLLAVGLVTLLTLVLGSGAPASAQTPAVTIDLVPQTVHFPADTSEVLITAVVRNPSDAPLVNARFLKIAEPGVNVDSVDATPRDVPAKSDANWVLRVIRTPADQLPPATTALFEYDQQPNNDPVYRKVVVAPINLVRPEIETTDPLIASEVRPSFDVLQAGDKGRIDLALTNKSATSIRVTVEVHWPADGSLGADGDIDPKELLLLPKSTGVVYVPVQASPRVRSGKQVIEFVIRSAWGSEAEHQTRTTVTHHSVTLDVLAEAAVLKFFGGVPLLLFLPGVLILLTWAMLWRVGVFRTRYDTAKFPLEPATLDFHLIAVLLSFVLLGVHVLVGFDYVKVYGFQDLVLLYVLSVAGYGVLVYALVMGLRWLCLRRRIPTMPDVPVKALKRLGAHGLGISRPSLERGTAAPKKVFLFERPVPESERPTTWIGPPIKFAWTVAAGTEVRDEIEPELTRLINLGADADSSKVARLIKKACEASAAKVEWISSGGLVGLTEVATKDAQPTAGAELIIEIHEE